MEREYRPEVWRGQADLGSTDIHQGPLSDRRPLRAIDTVAGRWQVDGVNDLPAIATNVPTRARALDRGRTNRLRAGWTAIALLFAAGVSPLADADPGSTRVHPVEEAVATLIAPVTSRVVVRNDEGGYDVWLRGDTAWDKARERIAGAHDVKLALSGGWRIAKATWIDADKAYWLDMTTAADAEPLRVRVTRDLQTVLVELRDCGVAKDAGRWAPPYAPMPVNLLHGPIR